MIDGLSSQELHTALVERNGAFVTVQRLAEVRSPSSRLLHIHQASIIPGLLRKVFLEYGNRNPV